MRLGKFMGVFDGAIAFVGFRQHQREWTTFACAEPAVVQLLLAQIAEKREQFERNKIMFVIAIFKSFGVGQHDHARTVGQQGLDCWIAAGVCGFFGEGITRYVSKYDLDRLPPSSTMKLTMHPVPMFGVVGRFFGEPTGRKCGGSRLLERNRQWPAGCHVGQAYLTGQDIHQHAEVGRFTRPAGSENRDNPRRMFEILGLMRERHRRAAEPAASRRSAILLLADQALNRRGLLREQIRFQRNLCKV